MGRRVLHTITSNFDPRASTVSLDFVTNEYLANTTNINLGITNNWTILAWFKPTSITIDHRILDLRATADNEARLRIHHQGAVANDPIQVWFNSNAATTIKDYRWASQTALSTWVAMLFTWDGTTLTGYFNGSEVAPTTLTTDSAGTVPALDRTITIGASSGGTTPLSGIVHSITFWNTAMNAAGALAASAVGHNPGSGGYGYRDNLVHWWRLGLPTVGSMAGTTYVCDAVASGGIDVSASAANMSDADIVADAPA